jgi:surface protein
MIQWTYHTGDYLAYLSTEDNRISQSSTKAQLAYLVKFINDMNGSVQYAYAEQTSTTWIQDRYTKMKFNHHAAVGKDIYAGDVNFTPQGHWKYEVYEVSWGAEASLIDEGTAPATELDVLLPKSDDNGIVQGLVTKGILNVTEKAGTEQVQYTQYEEPAGDNYIWYGGGDAPEDTFTFSINTANTSTDSSSSSQYQLPLVSAGAINMKVYWGDGSVDIITSYNQAETLHTYTSPGTYTINIENEVRGWQQYESATLNKKDHLKILDISKWSNFTITDDLAFSFSENMTVTATDNPTIETTTLAWCFRGCSNFNTNIGHWDISAVTSIASMFNSCTLFNQPLNGWNTSNVAVFGSAFQSCPAFNQPLNNWDTSSGVNFSNMFFGATIFNQSIGTWAMSSATNISGMFGTATAFNQDISGWDVRNVTIASNFFNLSGLSTENYDLLLVSWEANTPVASSLAIDFGTSQYSSGTPETARTNLISTHGWTITDGGLA